MNIGQKDGRIFFASPINPEDLPTTTHKILKWDVFKRELVAQTENRVGNILLKAIKTDQIEEEKAISVICEAIKREGNKLLPFSKEVNMWQARVMSLAKWNSGENWPDVSTEYLLKTTNNWLSPYLYKIRKAKELQKLNLLSILQNSLPYDLAENLNKLAPSKIDVPSGSSIKVDYFQNGDTPVLAVRLQEVFGLLNSPKINNGKNTLLLHLLSPGYKPVQITNDLQSFWQNTYLEVKKELKRRYPKHSWPENPLTAKAVRGVNRKRNN